MKMRVGVGDVEAALDDGGRHQDVRFAADEAEHFRLEFALVHLAVDDGHLGFGHDLSQVFGDDLNVMDPIVDEVDLALTVQLANDRMANQLLVEADDSGFDGEPIGRRRLQVADIANPQQRQVQRSRNRRRRHGQDIDLLAQVFEPFLVLDAEALLLVDDHQAEVLELDVLAHEAVRADDDIDAPLCQAVR